MRHRQLARVVLRVDVPYAGLQRSSLHVFHYHGAGFATFFFKSQPPIVVQVPGRIAHTDLSRVAKEHAKDVWLKSIMDWRMLKHTSALAISMSRFGENAAMASGAKTAPRLKLVSSKNGTLKAEENNKCEFEDILMHDRDVIS